MVPNYLFGLKGLSHGARLTYVLLLKYAWQEDRCFPGIERLGELLEVERKSVIRYTQELMQHGLISIERRGQGKTNVYHLNRWNQAPPENSRPVGSQEPLSGSPMHRTSGNPMFGTLGSPAHGTQILLRRQEPSRQINSVNADQGQEQKEAAHVEYLVDEIVKVCGDPQSTSFYRQVARRVDDSLIFCWLAEIRQDSTITNRGAIFTSKLKAWQQKHASPAPP